ncbi:hypothetical protein BC937DRAFT_92442 [Endogone sp. FLAS-F59071]|nr:hypothetical protein BC937DRAFT_92442 [Endogone sp. FLAS-F59071]|eukprot:RUS15437.1 hypothetical protein BC937DRAFT_92442 [Endogone sp. FLAS-F59071]
MQLKFALILCLLVALLISAAQAKSSKKSTPKKKSSPKPAPKVKIPSFVGKLLQKRSELTFYWRATNNDYPGGRTVTIGTCAGVPIAKVNKNFADNIVMEGSARLNNGLIVNSGNCDCGKGYNCFVTLDPKLFEWGESALGTALRPFVSVASNDLLPNSKIYVPQIAGWVTPVTKKKHNGCLLVDDTFSMDTSHHMDFYSLDFEYYVDLDNKYPTNYIDIYEASNCTLLDYMRK